MYRISTRIQYLYKAHQLQYLTMFRYEDFNENVQTDQQSHQTHNIIRAAAIASTALFCSDSSTQECLDDASVKDAREETLITP